MEPQIPQMTQIEGKTLIAQMTLIYKGWP